MIKNFYRKYRLEICVFILALAVRVIYFSVVFQATGYNILPTIHGDDGYYEISQGILSGHGFTAATVSPYNPTPLRPPFWPTLIAGIVYTFNTYWAVAIIEMIIGSLIPVIGMMIAGRLFRIRFLPFIVGLLLAFEPYGVFLSTNLYSETIFTFLLLIFFIFVIRYYEDRSLRNAVWMAVFLGLSILSKATVQYLPFIVPFFMLYLKRKNISRNVWQNIIVFILIILTLIGPWLYRNYKEFRVWGMSAQPAFNLYVYLVPTVLSIDNQTNFATELDLFIYKRRIDVNSINLSNSKYYSNQALIILNEHKTALVKSFGTTLVTFFTHDGMLTFFGYAGVNISNNLSEPALSLLINNPLKLIYIIFGYLNSPAIFVLIGRLVWILTTILFFLGIWSIWSRKGINVPILSAILIVVYFALTTSINGLGVNARFRTPVNTFVIIFAVYGLSNTIQSLRARLAIM